MPWICSTPEPGLHLLADDLAPLCARLSACALRLRSRQKRADLIFVNGAEPETLDPSIITGQPEGRIVNALFEGLTTFNAQGKSGPGMAESWTIPRMERPTLSRSVRMRSGATDGSLLPGLCRVLETNAFSETAASYNYQLFYVKNAQAFAEGKITDFSAVGVKRSMTKRSRLAWRIRHRSFGSLRHPAVAAGARQYHQGIWR